MANIQPIGNEQSLKSLLILSKRLLIYIGGGIGIKYKAK
jgi:hypothetical protein